MHRYIHSGMKKRRREESHWGLLELGIESPFFSHSPSLSAFLSALFPGVLEPLFKILCLPLPSFFKGKFGTTFSSRPTLSPLVPP